MAQHVPGSTERLAQLTGDYDPEDLPHLNSTGEWGFAGTDLGASAIYDDATFIFLGDAITLPDVEMQRPGLYNTDPIAFIDHFKLVPGGGIATAHHGGSQQLDALFVDESGRLYVSWVLDGGRWRGPVRISKPGMAPRGANLATAHQVDNDQLDVFFIGEDGALYVAWVVDKENWQGPVGISRTGIAPKGACVATAYQVDNHQLDVFFIGEDGALYVSSVVDMGVWEEPVGISPPGIAPKGGCIATSFREEDHRLDVFFIGGDGALYVTWVVDQGAWQGPVGISRRGIAPPGAWIATDYQGLNNQVDVFFIGEDGALYVAWAEDGGVWQEPVGISPIGIAPKGACVATAHQDISQPDVFFIGEDGALYVAWVDGDTWQGPVGITPTGVAPKGGRLATNIQASELQLNLQFQVDVVFIGNDKGLNVCWVTGDGTWQGPVNVSDGFRLTPILEDGIFFPFTYVENGTPHPLTVDSTPTGAFSYDGKMFVTFMHSLPDNKFFSGLSVSASPFAAEPYELLFKVSFAGESYFFQIAPCVVKNADYPDLHSLEEDGFLLGEDGLFMFGQGGNPDGDGVYLAWMPLKKGQVPQRETMRYYGEGKWYKTQNEAKPLFTTQGWSSISVGRIPGTGQWILLNQTSPGRRYPQTFKTPIIARIADTPWQIKQAQPIEIFDPVRDNAMGRYMYNAEFPDINNLKYSPPDVHPGLAYGPYILNHYTEHDARTDTATIYYLMSTGKPYQVQVMRSKISGLRAIVPTKHHGIFASIRNIVTIFFHKIFGK